MVISGTGSGGKTAARSAKLLGSACGLLLILTLASWLYAPRITAGMPYLYHEDEAHHLNRVFNMAKSGDLNPHYFLKPSLHFYLRLPVVYSAVHWGKNRGLLNSLQEVVTTDPFGLADYAFSVSHPWLAVWSRAFSVCLTLLLLAATFLLGRQVCRSSLAGMLAVLLVAVSPPVAEHAAVIGVDILMALTCTLSIYLALRLYESYSTPLLVFSGFMCGLAVSSKYNALPVTVLPFAVCILRGQPLLSRSTLTNFSLAALAIAAGFFVASPYILIEYRLFWDHLTSEVEHYAIKGHEGHMQERGLDQALFYLSWFRHSALGGTALLLAGLGAVACVLRRRRAELLFCLFPLLYLLMMIMQRTNFTRNMLVMIPPLSILAAYFLLLIAKHGRFRQSAAACIACAALVWPLRESVLQRFYLLASAESRIAAGDYLETVSRDNRETAVAGQLQFSRQVYNLPGVQRVDQEQVSPIALYLRGFDLLVSSPSRPGSPSPTPWLRLEREFTGDPSPQRLVVNPLIRVYSFVQGPHLSNAVDEYLAAHPPLPVTLDFQNTAVADCRAGAEGYCWLTSRVNYVELKGFPAAPAASELTLELMSPWSGQAVTLQTLDSEQRFDLGKTEVGQWGEYVFKLPAQTNAQAVRIRLQVDQVHSPKNLGISSDERSLGIALRRASR